MSFTRRAVFVGATACGIAAGLTALGLRVVAPEDDPLEPIRRIGRAYLAQAPQEASVPELTALLGLGGSVLSPEIVFDRVDEIRGDFERRETVLVDGWTLSLTEARGAALIALTSGP